MTAFRESIAETLSTVSKAKARSATLWGRVEKLRALRKKKKEKNARMLLAMWAVMVNLIFCLGYLMNQDSLFLFSKYLD